MDIEKIVGEVPAPRDGQSVCVYDGKLVVFGGDRFKFPFNDLFFYSADSQEEVVENNDENREDEEEEEQEPYRETRLLQVILKAEPTYD